ncbi:MAG: aminodeoxychorismate synthase component I [Woeseiaceae bacterium]|nr:aminodeoxychorismate synthase component I [Woeseiaceae bacterium]
MLRRILFRDPDGGWLSFENPAHVFVADTAADVPGLVAELETAQAGSGHVAAGYLAYEAAAGFDPALRTQPPDGRPVACFGLFAAPARLPTLPGAGSEGREPRAWTLATGRHAYAQKIAAIRREIARGNTYQVNFTLRLAGRAEDGGWPLFRRVSEEAPYAAWLEFDRFAIASASPELFFRLDGEHIVCRPMKGTARRGMTTSEDRAIAAQLEASRKNRAENVMITDMIRNDLGRIAEPGSVRVDALYAIEKYPTLWQMTSSVSARTEAGIGQILAALFPCASITGAPKKSSMDIIAGLEDGPRGVYTGAIGWFGPDRRATFSVAIRTAVVDRQTGKAWYGAGGGIVWDSDPDEEYDECVLKARVLGAAGDAEPFELLETLRWSAADGWCLLDEHLERLRDTAEYFDYDFERAAVEQALAAAVADVGLPLARVRLRLARDGTPAVTVAAVDDPVAEPVIRLAAGPIDPLDPFLYHKTTRRTVYERALRSVPGADDVLLWNPDGFVTSRPPVSAGLLAGTFRRRLLENGELEERPIHRDELENGMDITLFNSVRGLYGARLELPERAGRGAPPAPRSQRSG